jgi:hypothetical protein
MRLFAALVLLLASVTASEAAPNIVVIMTHDQEDTGSMAYMPKLHALLAEQGVTFTNSFVNLPLCAPSRASFLTGLSAHNTGIKANNPADGGGWEAFKDKEANALPVWLDRAGYKTALLGNMSIATASRAISALCSPGPAISSMSSSRARPSAIRAIGCHPAGIFGTRSPNGAPGISTMPSTRTAPFSISAIGLTTIRPTY